MSERLSERQLSNNELCDLINKFWLKQGYKAGARIERRSYVVQASRWVRRKNDEPAAENERVVVRDEIVSELVNGLPLSMVISPWVMAARRNDFRTASAPQ